MLQVKGWQVSASQRSPSGQSASLVHSELTQRKPSQSAGGGQSALVPQRMSGVH